MSWPFIRRIRLRPALILIATVIFVDGLLVLHDAPLTTHALEVPLNSTATVAQIPLTGLTALPTLLRGNAAQTPWVTLGVSLLQLGLSGSSASALMRAVEADPSNLMLRSALGEALSRSNGGRITPEAKSQFDAVLAADPNNLIARFYMAHWLLQNGKPKPALVKLVGLMRTVGNDSLWYDRLWDIMPQAADRVGVSPLALRALCVAGM